MADTLRAKVLELLKQDRKREYLNVCKTNYAEAVSVAQELFPEFYKGDVSIGYLPPRSPSEILHGKVIPPEDPFDSLYSKTMKKKEQRNTDEEIQILETAVANHSKMPYPYERLAILYSKAKNHKRAYEVCMEWFDSGFWKMPNSSTTSLRLLDRLEKLRGKLAT